MFAFLFRLRWYMFNFKHFLTILNTRNPEDGLNLLCAKIHNLLLREARKIFTYPGNVRTAPSTGADKQMVSSEVESSKCLDLSLKKSLKQSWIILKITTVISTCR